MAESEKRQSKNILVIAVVIALIVFSGIQTYYLIIMKDQLDSLQNQQAAEQSTEAAISQSAPSETHTQATADTVTVDNKVAEAQNVEQHASTSDTSQTATQTDDQHSEKDDIMSRRDNRQMAPRRPPPRPRSLFDDPFFNSPDPYGWDPYGEIERMQREMDRMFEDTYKQLNNRHSFRRHFSTDDIMPEIDIKENRNEYIVRVNLPGADENDISVTLDGQRLTIKGRRDQKSQEQDPSGNFVFRERRSGNFRRSITLREPVYEGGMKTKVINGVLTILIPKIL